MRLPNKRARSVGDVMSGALPTGAVIVRGTVRCDDHAAGGCRGKISKAPLEDAQGPKVRIDHRIMNKLPQHGGGFADSGRVDGAQGVADAEAHAVMGGEMEVHNVIWSLVSFASQSYWVKH